MTSFPSSLFLPRMETCDVVGILTPYFGRPADELAEKSFDLRRSEFHPRAAAKPSEGDLLSWREELNRWAWERGFPAPMDLAGRSRWDVELGSRLLADLSEVPELLHPRVWCWLATELLPHFVVHRWDWPKADQGDPPATTAAWRRFGDRAENGLRLVLHRVMVFGPETCLRATEQEFQSLRNRPAYGSDPRVAKIVLETLIEAFDNPDSNYGKNGGSRTLDANYVCIELRLINSLRPLAHLSDDRVSAVVTSVIERLPELRDDRDLVGVDDEGRHA